MTEFNFTVGSRWQSKGAGVGVVDHLDKDGDAVIVFEDRERWIYIDGNGGDNCGVPKEYTITGPAEPLHTPPAGKLTADEQEFEAWAADKHILTRNGYGDYANIRAALAYEAWQAALLSERARRPVGAE